MKVLLVCLQIQQLSAKLYGAAKFYSVLTILRAVTCAEVVRTDRFRMLFASKSGEPEILFRVETGGLFGANHFAHFALGHRYSNLVVPMRDPA